MTCSTLQAEYIAALNAAPRDQDEIDRLHALLVENECPVPGTEGESGGGGHGLPPHG